MIYANVLESPVWVLPGVPRIKDVTVKLAPAEMVYVNTPNVVEPFAPVRVSNITSPVAMLVLLIVTVPEDSVPTPIEFVAAKEAPLISRNFPAVAILTLPPVS